MGVAQMTHRAMLRLVVLGSLAGCTTYRTMDGEAVGRMSLQFVGLIVIAFLLYLGLSSAIARISQRSRLMKLKQAMRHRPRRIPQIRR
jgi:hypothetical protein